MSMEAIQPITQVINWKINKQNYVNNSTQEKTAAVTYEGVLYTYKDGAVSIVTLSPIERIFDLKV